MTEPKRLFDCLDYLLEQGDRPDLLAAKENGEWKKYSTSQIKSTVNQLTAGLLNLEIGYNDVSTPEGQDKVAILSKNRPEWVMLDLAIQQTGAILTPVYPTINVNELEFILNDAQVKVVFVNDDDTLEKVSSIKHKVPSIREIFSFEKTEGARHWKELLVPFNDDTKQKNKRNIG